MKPRHLGSVAVLLLAAPPLLASCSTRRAEWRALDNPQDAAAWERLGNARRRVLRHSQAVEAYAEAYALDPERTYLLDRMGGARSREVNRLRRLALSTPSDDETWGDLGDALRIEGDTPGAVGAYLRAYRIDPADSEWHDALRALGADDQLDELIESQLDTTSDESLGDWGDVLMAQGRRDEACEAYRQAAELDPWDQEWINHALMCGYDVPIGAVPVDTGLSGLGQLNHMGALGGAPGRPGIPGADALAGLQAQVDGDGSLLVRLGQGYLQAGDRERAEETLWGALLVAPTDEEALQSFLMATGRTEVDVRTALYNTFPDDDEVVGALADAHLATGDRDKAARRYAEAHDLDPEDPEWDAKVRLLAD